MATQNINNMSRTWNSGSTTYTAIKMDVTDAASAAASLLLALQVGGADKFTVAKTGNATLTNSDAGAGAGPSLTLHRDSASPADDDVIGEIVFAGEDDGSAQTTYARLYSQAKDVTDTTEDGALFGQVAIGGALKSLFELGASGFKVNDPSDPTKQALFGLSGLTTATTRTFTLPDASGTIPLLEKEQTFTALQTVQSADEMCIRSVSSNSSHFSFVRTSNDQSKSADYGLQDGGGLLLWARDHTSGNRVQIVVGGGDTLLVCDSAGNWGCGISSSITAKLHVVAPASTPAGVFATPGTTDTIQINANTGGSSGDSVYVLPIRTAGNLRGGVSYNGTNVVFNTTSDYRLPWKSGSSSLSEKQSGAFIDALNPLFFPQREQAGFFAHEFAKVSPSSVTGEKDAVDGDGQPVYQSMQASTADVIANIVAQVKFLRARVETLETVA